jgi:hypothetical protein
MTDLMTELTPDTLPMAFAQLQLAAFAAAHAQARK